MILIGMLHYRKNPFDVKKAYACAAVAKMEEAQFVYFSYRSVDFEKEKINGWVYEKGEWIKKELRLPDVIINNSAPKTLEQSIIRKALKRRIPFTSHPIGNKMQVFHRIRKGGQFGNLLIPSYSLKDDLQVFKALKKYESIVVKPFSGSQGRNIYFLSYVDQEIICMNGEDKRSFTKDECVQFIENLLEEQPYLLQPFIECKTKSGLTYDFRIHVQKDGNGNWVINLIYPRISGNNKLISNISGGGYRGELETFLKEEFSDRYFDMKQSLEYIAIYFADYFDHLYKKKTFDELGIDVGIDKDDRFWIYEVNWRPGSKNREFSVARNLIPYAMHLARKHKNSF